MRRLSVHPRSSTLGEMPRPISPRLHALRAAPPPQGLGAWRSALRCRCASDSSPARHAPAPGRSGSACTHHASTLIHAKAVDSAGGCKGGRRRKGRGRRGATRPDAPVAARCPTPGLAGRIQPRARRTINYELFDWPIGFDWVVFKFNIPFFRRPTFKSNFCRDVTFFKDTFKSNADPGCSASRFSCTSHGRRDYTGHSACN